LALFDIQRQVRRSAHLMSKIQGTGIRPGFRLTAILMVTMRDAFRYPGIHNNPEQKQSCGTIADSTLDESSRARVKSVADP
jgi:hypothetical protein